MPLVRVTLRSVGGELRGVRASVEALPDEFLLQHSDLYDDYANATKWPKHVLVHYEFESAPAESIDSGLYVVTATGE